MSSSPLQVSGVHTLAEYPPVGLGMCLTHAREALRTAAAIRVSSELLGSEDALRATLSDRSVRHVLLFSNYLWNSASNLHLSRLAKEWDPSCVTIHGGPDSPSYPGAAREFLRREPHVDYIVVGEGELTLVELLRCLAADGSPHDVSGLRFLREGDLVATAARPRLVDLQQLPSPYLSGFFDDMDHGAWQSATIETYRGCPYECAFCDWGSSIGSRIRSFDLERVRAEIEWVAAHHIPILWIADSNFGMIERDVEITRMVCDAKRRHGFPQALVLTFAKNVKSRVVDIVQMMVEAGLLATGILSLQTIDPATLRAVRRTNIRTSEYEKLRATFAARGLPLNVELMMALPGATLRSFKADLAYHFDLPLEVSVNRTIVLPNSPMADPAYRAAHGIVSDAAGRILRTSTMSEDDIERAGIICRLFYGVHRFGVLRYLLRWLEWERGLQPLDLLDDLVADLPTYAQARPVLAALVQDALVASPYELATSIAGFRDSARAGSRWEALGEQFVDWARGRYPIGTAPELEALAAVQAAVMPTAGRTYPYQVAMTHNVAAWYAGWLAGEGRPLADLGPHLLEVRDPHQISGRPCLEASASVPGHQWELDFAMAEARRASASHLATNGMSRALPSRDTVDAHHRTPSTVTNTVATSADSEPVVAVKDPA